MAGHNSRPDAVHRAIGAASRTSIIPQGRGNNMFATIEDPDTNELLAKHDTDPDPPRPTVGVGSRKNVKSHQVNQRNSAGSQHAHKAHWRYGHNSTPGNEGYKRTNYMNRGLPKNPAIPRVSNDEDPPRDSVINGILIALEPRNIPKPESYKGKWTQNNQIQPTKYEDMTRDQSTDVNYLNGAVEHLTRMLKATAKQCVNFEHRVRKQNQDNEIRQHAATYFENLAVLQNEIVSVKAENETLTYLIKEYGEKVTSMQEAIDKIKNQGSSKWLQNLRAELRRLDELHERMAETQELKDAFAQVLTARDEAAGYGRVQETIDELVEALDKLREVVPDAETQRNIQAILDRLQNKYFDQMHKLGEDTNKQIAFHNGYITGHYNGEIAAKNMSQKEFGERQFVRAVDLSIQNLNVQFNRYLRTILPRVLKLGRLQGAHGRMKAELLSNGLPLAHEYHPDSIAKQYGEAVSLARVKGFSDPQSAWFGANERWNSLSPLHPSIRTSDYFESNLHNTYWGKVWKSVRGNENAKELADPLTEKAFFKYKP
ncbi:hypothetical protein BDV96DRAFT_642812 [Lophiotrema nucula]|uniref:Uncharacterized protein n=1 Tax=Lophiotrema nucula TaxID=690887 RepID=A0A6A5ZLB9_9PLEO|nr:hypothetical protein BDV96DRAFT_642812 [Lophiotrema nucula]